MSATAPASVGQTKKQSTFALVAMIASVMLAMMLEMLDSTVVNVALPHMMGTFGATSDQILWVTTSYLVASATVMPLTGYLVQRLGRRRLLLLDIICFLITSAACGMSQTLSEIVIFRLLQGVAGGTLAPLAQAVMIDGVPPEKRGSIMAVFGLGMMVVPVLGPSLGGFLTESLNWRWVFYVNIPIGLFALVMASAFIPASPRTDAHTDWFGLALLVLTVGAFQLMLSEGNSHDWFESPYIQALAFAGAIAFLAFISHTWQRPGAIVNLEVYKDRNFVLSSILTVCFSVAMFGIMTVIPLMLEQLAGYPADKVGLVMAPRGLLMGVFMLIIGPNINKLEMRAAMSTGVLFLAIGTYIYAYFPINASPFWYALPGLPQALGMSLFFIPSSLLAYDTMPRHLYDAAAGLSSVVRTIGGSIGVAIIGLLLSRRTQYHWQTLGGHITPDSPATQAWLDAHHMAVSDPAAGAMLGAELGRQALSLAFGDVFVFMGLTAALVAPLVLFMKRQTVLTTSLPMAH
jgi:DHA2 family multidrug resistance protein